ncbi:MAG TPA: low temperature requirement protein A [Acidimicrobiales bacterium]|nr:low temperature requirement protein A [Acidimicrobiales bacterium]
MARPSTSERDSGDAADEKRVTWAELFFDLVFVFAITQVSALLHEEHSWAGVGRALILFVPIYWGWVGTSIHANVTEVDTPLERLGIFAVGLCSLIMALGVVEAFGERGVVFGAGYLLLRIVLAAVVFRGWRMSPNNFSVGLLVSGPLLLAGGIADGPARVWLWAVAAFIDLATPTILRKRLVKVQFDASHLPERFGLFVIIALGESIVAIGSPAASAGDLYWRQVLAVALAFALACGLWWVYFAYAASAVRHALSTASVQTDIVREVLSYGHLLLLAGIIALAVGLAEIVAHADRPLELDVASLLFGGTALYLATFGYTRYRMFRQWSTTRLGAAVIVIALLPVAPRVTGLVALSVLVAIVVTLNLVEHRRVARAAPHEAIEERDVAL